MTHDEYVISGPLRRVVVVTRGGPGSGFKKHKGRPGKVGGSLPKNAWTRHGFSIEEFTKKPDLPREQVPELGKDVSIVYSGRGNKARWVAAVRDSLERFRNATGFAPQGITITDHLPWVFWRSTPYEVLANMPDADAKEIANVLMTGPFAAARGVYVGGNERTIYVAPELVESLPPNLSWTHELGLQDFHETMAHELGHWLTMTAAPVAYQMVAPNARYREVAGRSYPSSSFASEYAADLVASLARPGGRTWPWRLDHATMTEPETRERQDLMEGIRHNLVLRTTKEQPGLMVLVLMGDEIVAVPEGELNDLPEGAIINPLYLWWKEHFQPKVELELDAKAFGWEAEDIAVQGEPEDGIFAVVEEVQRPKGRKETMAEAAGQEPAPVPPDGETPAGGPGEADVKSAFETIMRGTPTTPPEVQGAESQGLSWGDFGGLFTRFIGMLEKVRVPVVHVDVAPADIHFHAPEQPAPVVNLTLPETNVTIQPTLVVPPAEVTVNVPPHPKHMTERQTVKRSPDKTITEITGEREYWDDEENTGG